MTAKLVVGNWKMNGSLASNRKLVRAMLEDARINRPGVALAAPYVYLLQLADLLQMSPMGIAAQNASQFENDGAYTGEVSASMLANVGCRYVLLGHSERRQYFAERDEVLHKKMVAVLKAQLMPIFCVGETLAQRSAGEHLAVIKRQLEVVMALGSASVVIAYEPVWAIGTGQVATIDQIREIHDVIKGVCLQRLKGSDNMRVLYGGSVKADNADAILSIDGVDGALVGGASLDVDSFGIICRAADILV